MEVNIAKITSAMKKISDLTSGDKQVPGVLLTISENSLAICYTDGHKSLTETIEVETNENDKMGSIVVNYEPFLRAINNCQPSGIIKVDSMTFSFNENILKISADQSIDITDEEGNIVGSKKCANKSMDLIWKELNADLKTSILSRTDYESIFDFDNPDKVDRKELMSALTRTSVEKGKQVYISMTQSVFVANQAHVTSIPISKYEITPEELAELKAELESKGEFSTERFNQEVENRTNRLHYPITMPQAIAKAVSNILNSFTSDDVYLYTRDKHCNIFVDNETEKVGICFEMPKAAKVHIDALKGYEGQDYKSYQITFLREFLDNNIKSALNATKSEKVAIEFKTENDELGLNIIATSAQASIADNYRVIVDSVVDPTNDLEGKKFNVSLKVLSDMMAQLKTVYVAMDLHIRENGTTSLRLAEIDYDKLEQEYNKSRQLTEQLCKEQGIAFDPTQTPTPIELKLDYRNRILLTKQYSILAS